MEFYRWLEEAARRNDSLLCVGLDPRPERLEPGDDLFSFNRRIVDATQDLVCAYKPNFAFYEAAGPTGLEALRRTVTYIHDMADLPVLLDAKRGDIGSTARAYARAAFEVWGSDALTYKHYPVPAGRSTSMSRGRRPPGARASSSARPIRRRWPACVPWPPKPGSCCRASVCREATSRLPWPRACGRMGWALSSTRREVSSMPTTRAGQR